MTYRVQLDVFEGPIDLLLHLITRQRVDIYEVSLATVTEEYLEVLSALPATDLETATGFLVVAASLLELKSARLLPVHSPGGEEHRSLLEERDLLLARLVECSTFREAGAWLGVRLALGARRYPRTADLEPQFRDMAAAPVAKISVAQIAQAAADALSRFRAPEVELKHVAPVHLSVREAIVELAGRLAGMGTASFFALCPARASRAAVVVRFLALLELYKAGAVELAQPQRLGEIEVVWTGLAGGEEVAMGAEEYTAQASQQRGQGKRSGPAEALGARERPS